jgi:di/tricarboxylate transporter
VTLSSLNLDLHAVAVLAGLLVALVLLSRERLPLVVTSLGIMATLSAGFYLFPYVGVDGRPVEPIGFFSGFGHEALVAICALMVLGRGLVLTGALEPLARVLASIWQQSRFLSVLAILLTCLALSGVVNDTPIVVLMTPVLVSLAARTGTSPAPLLMPMNFAVIIGGMATTMGTSTNLLVVSLAAELGTRRFGIFDFTPLVAMAAAPALLYLLFVMPRILARSGNPVAAPVAREYHATLRVRRGSFAEGRTVSRILDRSDRIHIRAIQNAEGRFLAKLPTVTVQAGFQLHLRGTPAELKECEVLLGGQLHADASPDVTTPAPADEMHLAEMIISADSPLVGRALGELDLSARYGLLLLGVHRNQPPHDPDIRHWHLHVGDMLLVQGSTRRIEAAKQDRELLTLDSMVSLPRTRQAPLALLITAAVVGTAAAGILPIALAAVIGAVVMLLTGCVLPRQLGKAVSTEIILLIPASLALGKALTVTGGAAWVAGLLEGPAGVLPVSVVLAILLAIMSLLTNFVSNNAAAVIGTPIAIAIAGRLGLPPEPFALAVLFGCNLCFATPIGYQTNLIVMSAAGYRFNDFVKAGLPLVALMIGMFAWLLPRWYGL